MTEDELVRRYEPVAFRIARRFYFPGGDRDDVEQEARVGILVAIRDYDPSVGVPLDQFVGFCVERWLIAKLRGAHRVKHLALNESARTAVNDEGEEEPIVERLPTRALGPFERLAFRETVTALADRMPDLSPMELRCIRGLILGCSYAELGEPKQVDNAVQRARQKLRSAA